MKKIFTIIILIFSINMYSQTSTYTDYDGDGLIEYSKQNEQGRVIETGFYYNNKMHGTWISYYPSGKKQSIVKFRNGVKHGKWIFLDESGRTLLVVLYENDKKIMATQNQYASN
jgi:antitoxin component YwqK of YwqJK toxin-antitoxin module